MTAMGQAAGAGFAGRIRSLSRQREISLLVVLVLVVVVATMLQPRFLDVSNFSAILQSAAIVSILAIGQALVVISRNVDLSVGSELGLCAFAAAAFMSVYPETPVIVAAVGAMVLGAVLGAANGALGRGRARAGHRGHARYAVRLPWHHLLVGRRGQHLRERVANRSSPLSTATVLGVPIPVVVTVLVVLITAMGIREFAAARGLYAVGDNPEAARIEGIRSRRVVFLAMLACGAFAGLASILYITRFGAVNARRRHGLEFQSVAAVVVGGVSILGGIGTVTGAFVGAVLLATIANALNVLDLSPFWIQAIDGMAILVAVTVDMRLRRRLDRPGAER